MFKLLTIIGARPQIIKAAALSRAIRNNFPGKVEEMILHTGQHYDDNMSAVFFEEMEIPRPQINLNVGSGSHGKQTATMISGIEDAIDIEKPQCIIIYGDTNSTLAGAIAGSKLHVPVVHIEAGMRSFNKEMPEEINRILADHASTLLFTPTRTGYRNLINEGFKENSSPPYSINNPGICQCGDIMYDNSLFFAKIAGQKSALLNKNGLEGKKFVLATIHRDFNTDNPKRLNNFFRAFCRLASYENIKVVIPLHPRTRKLLAVNLAPELLKKVSSLKSIVLLPPVSYLDMIVLENHAFLIMTDSGGVQKEAFFFKKPCITLRPETEWVELVENGNNILADDDEERIIDGYRHFTSGKSLSYPQFYGDGKAAGSILEKIVRSFS